MALAAAAEATLGAILLKNIERLATMDEGRRELSKAAIYIQDSVVAAVGALEDMPDQPADRVLDLSRHVVLPGLINTHHHMFQSLTRCLAQDHELFDWLRTLYPIWARLRGGDIYASARLAMVELMLSGCTTSSDHLYLYPNDVTLEDEIRAAQELGLRFHAARGAISLGESAGGLPPDDLVEDEAEVLRDMRRLIETWHDPQPGAMLQIVLAPCSPFSVTPDLMRESAALARAYGVHLHTHLAENDQDIAYGLERFGLSPSEYAESVGWLGGDVWHAHCVKLNDRDIQRFAGSGVGVCHCPSSNMRLASGIAPIRKMLDQRLRVSLGVDGSASNDSGHMLGEARQALLLSRANGDPAALTAREALEMATRGGARNLGRTDLGQIAVGKTADIIAYRLDTPALAGAWHDPIAALVFTQPAAVDLSIINGQIKIEDGRLTDVDLPQLIDAHNQRSRRLIRGDD